MSSRFWIGTLCLGMGLGIGVERLGRATEASQAPSVELTGWEGEARLYENPLPGEDLFRLKAVARWLNPGAIKGRPLSIHVTLPSGRVDRRPIRPGEGPGSRLLTVSVPAEAVLNLPPEAVRIEAVVVDRQREAALGNRLAATIEQFPTPRAGRSKGGLGPFGWGRPIGSSGAGAAPLRKTGPDEFQFVRIFTTENEPGFFISATEASNEQVEARLPDYDPNAGRSDEFLLDDPSQPALNLTPNAALAYLEALGEADPSGASYRLPTPSEWERAARAGRSTRFWWGDEREHPDGANFLGLEPGTASDTTNTAAGFERPFLPNPWGLLHTFGNVAEWATADGSTFLRMGGHFRTEPDQAAEPVVVEDPDSTGPDPFVGARPVLDLDAETGARLVLGALNDVYGLSDLSATFDPDRAAATIRGRAADPQARAAADRALRELWFLSALENGLETPSVPEGMLAELGPPVGEPEPLQVIDRLFVKQRVDVLWARVLPVQGSSFYVNIFRQNDMISSHRLEPHEIGRDEITVVIPRAMARSDRPVRVALSLGAPVSSTNDPRLVSEPVAVVISEPPR